MKFLMKKQNGISALEKINLPSILWQFQKKEYAA